MLDSKVSKYFLCLGVITGKLILYSAEKPNDHMEMKQRSGLIVTMRKMKWDFASWNYHEF